MSRNYRIKEDTEKDYVTSREGRVSRNGAPYVVDKLEDVTSREGRVSRNLPVLISHSVTLVTSREGRVSRNF